MVDLGERIPKWNKTSEKVSRLIEYEATYLANIFGFQLQQKHKGTHVPSNLKNQIDHLSHILMNMIPRDRKFPIDTNGPPASGEQGEDLHIAGAVAELHAKMLTNYHTWATSVNADPQIIGKQSEFEMKLTINNPSFEPNIPEHLPAVGEASDADASGPQAREMVGMKRNVEDLKVILTAMGLGFIETLPPSPELTLGRNTRRTRQLVLMFLVWGEAANLRHTPECLMLIYHAALCHISQTPVPTPHTPEERKADPTMLFPTEDFLESIVTPWFKCIRECTSKTMSVPAYPTAALDVTYDDFNECFNNPRVVEALLSAKSVTDGTFRVERACTTAYDALRAYLRNLNAEIMQLERENKSAMDAFKRLSNDMDPPVMKDTMETFHKLFEKTYQEQRSWAHVFYSFKRVYTFHAALFHILVVIAFQGFDTRYMATVVLTHASLEYLHSVTAILLNARVVKLATATPGVAFAAEGYFTDKIKAVKLYLISLFAKFGCFLLNTCILGALVSATFSLKDPHNGTFVTLAGLYVIWCALTFIATTRNGYVADIWFYFRTSALPNHLKVDPRHFFQYTLFWVIVIVLKVLFNYFLMIKPMVEVSNRLWVRRWLNTGVDEFSPDGDFLLVLLRWSAPALMALADTSIFYILVASLWSAVGGIRQRLGATSKWHHIIRNFTEYPERFSTLVLSTQKVTGTSPDMGSKFSKEPRSGHWFRFAHFWNQVVEKLRKDDLLSDKERDELKFIILENRSEAKNFFGSEPHYVIYPCLMTSGVCHNDSIISSVVVEDVDDNELASSGVIVQGNQSHVKDQLVDLAVLLMVSFGLAKETERERVRASLASSCGTVYLWMQEQTKKDLQQSLEKFKKALIECLQVILHQYEMATFRTGARDIRQVTLAFQTWKKKMEKQDLSGFKADLGSCMQKVISEWSKLRHGPDAYLGQLKEKAKDLDILNLRNALRNSQLKAVVRSIWMMVTCNNVGCEPKCEEARRQLQFFGSSLYHPKFTKQARKEGEKASSPTPEIRKMKSWSALVPFYGEDVVYSMKQLTQRTTEGVHLLDYLKSQYRDEYANFVERINKSADEILTSFDMYGLRAEEYADFENWATDRGQLLARTVHGVMNNEKALKETAILEGYTPAEADEIVASKFHFVVTAQIYGQQRAASKESNFDNYWKAESIDVLRKKYPRNLRLAFVESAPHKKSYSVCLGMEKNAAGQWVDKVLYKVRLPDNPIIGYGKPENQNHAIVFAHGEFLQVLDMNQDHYLAEAYKMRNLLEEFDEDTALVGFREHIFSQSSGAVASFAASTEFTFGTLVQRFLARPLNVRFHYGHPDIFDKLWTMTRGGLSKACKDLHVSEDIFGGFNVMMRGKKVKYCEFVHCGKGRDMGFSQINGFEEKISGGNGLQCLSRDVHRLGKQMDFFRLMSFYASGPGQYVNAVVLVSAVYMFILTQVVLALSDSEVYCGIDPLASNSSASWNDCGIDDETAQVSFMYSAEWTLQLGFITILPQLVELVVEFGWGQALITVSKQFLAGSWVFFTFVMQTKAYYFDRALVVGGAGYVATGRGYQIENTNFVKLYTWYARSHIYFGVELLVLLILYLLATGQRNSYLTTTWSVWLFGVSFVLGPWWFNPLSFTWANCLKNFDAWSTWINKDISEKEQQGIWDAFNVGLVEKQLRAEYKEEKKEKLKEKFEEEVNAKPEGEEREDFLEELIQEDVKGQALQAKKKIEGSILNPESSWEAWNRKSLKVLRESPWHVKVYTLVRKLPLLAVTLGAITALQVSDGNSRFGVFFASLATIWFVTCAYSFALAYLNANNVEFHRSASGRLPTSFTRLTYTACMFITLVAVVVGVVAFQTRRDTDATFNFFVVVIATGSVSQFLIQVASYAMLTRDPNNWKNEELIKYYRWRDNFINNVYKLNDRLIGYFIFGCLFGLSIIPMASIQSHLLFNSAFSDDLKKTKRQAEVIGQALNIGYYKKFYKAMQSLKVAVLGGKKKCDEIRV